MKITFQQNLSEKEWINKELMHSLTGDLCINASEREYFEVKLLVDGVELEPTLFNQILSNIDKIIDSEALNLYNQKYAETISKLKQKMSLLEETLDEAKDKITDEFNL